MAIINHRRALGPVRRGSRARLHYVQTLGIVFDARATFASIGWSSLARSPKADRQQQAAPPALLRPPRDGKDVDDPGLREKAVRSRLQDDGSGGVCVWLHRSGRVWAGSLAFTRWRWGGRSMLDSSQVPSRSSDLGRKEGRKERTEDNLHLWQPPREEHVYRTRGMCVGSETSDV